MRILGLRFVLSFAVLVSSDLLAASSVDIDTNPLTSEESQTLPSKCFATACSPAMAITTAQFKSRGPVHPIIAKAFGPSKTRIEKGTVDDERVLIAYFPELPTDDDAAWKELLAREREVNFGATEFGYHIARVYRYILAPNRRYFAAKDADYPVIKAIVYYDFEETEQVMYSLADIIANKSIEVTQILPVFVAQMLSSLCVCEDVGYILRNIDASRYLIYRRAGHYRSAHEQYAVRFMDLSAIGNNFFDEDSCTTVPLIPTADRFSPEGRCVNHSTGSLTENVDTDTDMYCLAMLIAEGLYCSPHVLDKEVEDFNAAREAGDWKALLALNPALSNDPTSSPVAEDNLTSARKSTNGLFGICENLFLNSNRSCRLAPRAALLRYLRVGNPNLEALLPPVALSDLPLLPTSCEPEGKTFGPECD